MLENTCFTEDWLNQEEADGILTMTSTYMDYFNDLSVWIESKYFLGAIMYFLKGANCLQCLMLYSRVLGVNCFIVVLFYKLI